MSVQLDFYGGETDHVEVTKASSPLSPAQREILRLLNTYGTITSTAAGRIIHAHRENVKNGHRHASSYHASDGRDALMRLKARGLVRRVRVGVWVAR